MLSLIDELGNSRLDVDNWNEPSQRVIFYVYAPSQQARTSLDREQVEILYNQLGSWLTSQNSPFVSDVV